MSTSSRSSVDPVAPSTLAKIPLALCALTMLFGMSSAGCKSSGLHVQKHVPSMAHTVAGPLACPRCGLLRHQGCMCRPDEWNAGYHPTMWSYIEVPQLNEPPCDAQPIHTAPLEGTWAEPPAQVPDTLAIPETILDVPRPQEKPAPEDAEDLAPPEVKTGAANRSVEG